MQLLYLMKLSDAKKDYYRKLSKEEDLEADLHIN